MSENNNVEKKSILPEKKNLIILITVVSVCFLFALIPILIATRSTDTGESFDGTYYLSLGVEVGQEVYIFSEGRKVENKLMSSNGKTESTIYTYEIHEKDGKKTIRLTDINTGEVTTYPLKAISFTRNTYDCSNENCPIDIETKDNGGVDCKCGGKLTPVTKTFYGFEINGADYYDQNHYDWINK